MSRTSLVLRSLFLIGFVVAMPLLALPSVARRMDELLYGGPEAESPAEDWNKSGDDAAADEKLAQAAFETPLVESSRPRVKAKQERGLDAVAGKPPEFAPLPEFPAGPLDENAPQGKPDPALNLRFRQDGFNSDQPQRIPSMGPIADDSTADRRIREIRQRLEDLGADYILLEFLEGPGQYHFHCRMLAVAGSAETESFEATGNDAIAVAEQVLKAVESWRARQTSRPR